MLHDARIWQVGVLGGVLGVGIVWLDFPLSWSIISATLASGILGEYGFNRLFGADRTPRPLSAVISALSVLLLFRSAVFWTYPLVTLIALSSKYCIRLRGQHFLNPTNCGILLGTLFLPGWISSGQWGHVAWLPLALGGLGILVLFRAGRLDSGLTFLGTTLLLELVRLAYYGYPVATLNHHFQNGALWLFAFYMLTDPKTTPERRWARAVHASGVALLSFVLAEWWYWTDTFLWALFFLAPLVPFLNWLAEKLNAKSPYLVKEERSMQHPLVRIASLFVLSLVLNPSLVNAFCGFYVSRADAKLYNSASQVVLVRDENKTVLTMVNNYQGDPKEFAMVVPVPVVLEREMVRVIDPKVVAHLDAYSAPRLVEYHDPDPCGPVYEMRSDRMAMGASSPLTKQKKGQSAAALGVRIEAEYSVGEYDIVILSAKQSDGLETWLRHNNYNIPTGAATALAPYIRSGLKFFVAKVDLKEHKQSGFSSLRPLQFAFESPRFMLPIRLGMLNADGPQNFLVYFLTKQYRVEVTNYRNPKVPSNQEIPVYVKQEFRQFYTDLFQTATTKENQQAVFTEYAWNMGWCDPCAAEPLSAQELETLGVWWLFESQRPGMPGFAPRRGGGGMPVFVTRLHARYDAQHFPEDLKFKITGDTTNFQGRYILRHPWKGKASCQAGEQYLKQLVKRQETEAQTLSSLTGWDLSQIHTRMALEVPV
jgi:hypothetical protein